VAAPNRTPHPAEPRPQDAPEDALQEGQGNPEQASSVEAQFDKAARKGIIHPNKAARKKARLARAIRTAAAAAAAAPAATVTATKKRGTKKNSLSQPERQRSRSAFERLLL